MVYYFVIAEDGSRYGPADIDTLVQWAREGRVVDSTILIERGTERQVKADSITAIAAELRRRAEGGTPISIERDDSPSPEAPTLTQPGVGAANAGFDPQTQFPPTPTAPGGPPPVPPIMPYARRPFVSQKSKIVAGLLGIFLGGFGIHRFYLGYTGIGILQIVVTVATCGWGSLWGFVEGIICLVGGMRDADGLELRD
ncbi:MAG: TM2 domain-containing protein [Phycisphaerae bacterium]